jgi:hypothetical protein
MTDQKSANPNLWLEQFKIEVFSGSSQLYSNGRQQVAVRITLKPLAGQVVTPEQFASLNIVHRTSTGSYEIVSDEPQVGRWWQTMERNEYDYYSTSKPRPFGLTLPQLQNDLAVPPIEKIIYIITSATPGSTETFFAQVTQNQESTHVTDDVFDSNIVLLTVAVPRYSAPEDYEFDRKRISGSESSGIFVFEYHINPKVLGFVSLRSPMEPHGMIQWDDKTQEETHASHVGHAGPNSLDVTYDEDIKLGTLFQKVIFITDTHPRTMAIVLQGGINIPYDSPSANAHNGPCSMGLIDNNGNEHNLRIRFSGETGFENRINLELLNA